MKADAEKQIRKDIEELREILTITWCAISGIQTRIDRMERRLMR